MEVLDLTHSLQYAGCSLVLAGLFFICSLKPLAILQQCGYKNRKMLQWYCRKDNLLFQRYCLLFMMLALTCGLLGVCFSFLGGEWAFVITWLPFPFFCVLFYLIDRKYALKVPFNETERVKRLALVYFCLLALFLYFFMALFNVIAYYAKNDLYSIWRYVPLSLTPFAIPVILCVANAIDRVYENAKNKKYVTHAREKLEKSGAIKIGITGSFAKTSVKNILTCLLKEKYSVLPTTASYNTPMGIAKCVNSYTGAPYEIFIAEMGARGVGDIAELCALVQPDYSIITGVCAQHLETFGTIENIIATKGEIFFGTKEGGKVVLSKDENTEKIVTDQTRTAIWVDDKAVQDVVCTHEGTSFTLLWQGEELKIRTKLLGRHTAKNIALAAVLALQLGVSGEQIVAACEKLEYVPHRLQVIKNGEVTIIDDSYNANVKGAAQAVEVLKSFAGRKIIVTPGIIELGVLQEDINAALGESLVGLDGVILVGDTLVGAVKTGYLRAGGDVKVLSVVPTLQKAQDLLAQTVRAGDVVLFLNDLPDVY